MKICCLHVHSSAVTATFLYVAVAFFVMSSYHSQQFKYMIFHIILFTCILHHLRVYYELTR